MRLLDITVFSLLRQKSKKFFLLVAIIIGCATIVTLYSFVQSQRNKIEAQFDEYGANIVISPKSDQLSLTYGGINVSPIVANIQELHTADVANIFKIANKDNLRAVSPKLIGSAFVRTKSKKGFNAMLVGVDFTEEQKIKTWWEIAGKTPAAQNEIILGSDFAKKLDLRSGNYLEINRVKMKIVGVLAETGSQDDSLIFAKLAFTANLLDKPEKISLIEVSALCSDCPIDELIRQISKVIPKANVKGVKQVMKQKMEMLAQFEKFAFIVSVVVAVIGSMLIFISMMGAVNERKKEIAIFRAIGFKKSHLAQIILLEAFIICLIASIVGVIVGLGLSAILLPWLTGISGKLVSINPIFLAFSVISVISLGLLASIYPAKAAADTDPIIALHSI